MRVRGQKTDDLVARDAHSHCPANRLPRDLPRHHVRVTGPQPGEELQNSNLQLGSRIGVHAVIGFDDDEALAICGAERVVEAGGDAAEGAGVGGEGCGEAGGIEAAGGWGVLVDDAKVGKVFKHLPLGGGKGRFAVVLAELKATEHEKEG